MCTMALCMEMNSWCFRGENLNYLSIRSENPVMAWASKKHIWLPCGREHISQNSNEQCHCGNWKRADGN